MKLYKVGSGKNFELFISAYTRAEALAIVEETYGDRLGTCVSVTLIHEYDKKGDK